MHIIFNFVCTEHHFYFVHNSSIELSRKPYQIVNVNILKLYLFYLESMLINLHLKDVTYNNRIVLFGKCKTNFRNKKLAHILLTIFP